MSVCDSGIYKEETMTLSIGIWNTSSTGEKLRFVEQVSLLRHSFKLIVCLHELKQNLCQNFNIILILFFIVWIGKICTNC